MNAPLRVDAHGAVEASLSHTTLAVPGMHCAGCMGKVERALAALGGRPMELRDLCLEREDTPCGTRGLRTARDAALAGEAIDPTELASLLRLADHLNLIEECSC